jgi:hypothetical protein
MNPSVTRFDGALAPNNRDVTICGAIAAASTPAIPVLTNDRRVIREEFFMLFESLIRVMLVSDVRFPFA